MFRAALHLLQFGAISVTYTVTDVLFLQGQFEEHHNVESEFLRIWRFSAKYFKTFLISFLHDTDVRIPTFVGNVGSC